MRRRARTDAPHSAIREALRAAGWRVFDMSRVGDGFPDLIAARRGEVRFLEVKDGQKSPSRRQLTPDEVRVHADFLAAGVSVAIVESVEEAVRL